MKPRRLILHAGPHKTGTSAIQAVLRNQPFDAFHYPKAGQWPDGSHHNLIFSLVPELRRPDAEILEPGELLAQLGTELEDIRQGTLFISSEFLSTGCAPAVVSWLVSHGLADPDGIQVLLVERDVLSRAASLYNQAVKDPYVGETRSPDQWLMEEAPRLVLGPMLEDFRAVTATVAVLPYEPAESLVRRVLLAAGARNEELPDQIPWTNISMSEPVLMALLEVNRTVADPERRIELREHLFQEISPAFTPSKPELFCRRL